MNYEFFEKIVQDFKENPKKTIVIIVIILLFTFLSSFFNGLGVKMSSFCSDGTSKDDVKIEQKTKGDQSPAIISNG